MYIKKLMSVVLLSLSLSALSAEDAKTTVACVGDSITWGMTVENRAENCYPMQLGVLLGESYDVQNFGSSGATCIRSTPDNAPYIKRPVYGASLRYSADIVVIMLGANDSKPFYWDKEVYLNDYTKLIEDYRRVNSKVKVYLCLPVSSFTKLLGPWDCNEGNLSMARMLVKEFAKEQGCELIDTYSPLKNRKYFSPDGVHPNASGAKQIAQTVYKSLK